MCTLFLNAAEIFHVARLSKNLPKLLSINVILKNNIWLYTIK